MEKKSSVGFISLSAFLHAGILLGLVMIPALKMLPEGDEAVVEIISESSAQAPIQESAPVPAAPPVVAPEPAPAPPASPVVKAKKSEPKIVKAKSQPPKPLAKIIPVDMSDDVSQAQVDAEKFAKEQVDEVKPMADEAPAKPVDAEDEVLDSAASTAAAEAVTKQEAAEEAEPPLPAPIAKQPVTRLSDIEETKVQEEAPAVSSVPVTDTPGDKSGNSLNEFAGPAPDELRSHLDLKQLGNNKPPEYPVTARRNGSQGEVLLNYFVTQQGVVQNVKVARSSGNSELDKEAVRAISKYKYVAGQEGWASHPVLFSLKGPTAAQPSRLRTSGSSAKDGQ